MGSELMIRQDEALLPTTFEGLLQQAELLVKSGLLPKSIKTASAAIAIILTGREMGLPPMQAFRSIYIVDGQPCLSAQLIAAKLLEAGIVYQVTELTNERCTIAFSRSNGMALTYSYSWEDAGAAGLSGKQNWKQYRRDMLWSRAITLGGRKIAPDALAGFHTAEELGATVNPMTGDVVDAEAREVASESETAPTTESAQVKASETEANPQPHWIEDEKSRARFWARCDNLGLGKPAVHREFGVASMKDCRFSEATVIALLDFLEHAIVDARLKLAEVHEALNIGKIADLATGEMGRKTAAQKIAAWIARQTEPAGESVEKEVEEAQEQAGWTEQAQPDDEEEVPF